SGTVELVHEGGDMLDRGRPVGAAVGVLRRIKRVVGDAGGDRGDRATRRRAPRGVQARVAAPTQGLVLDAVPAGDPVGEETVERPGDELQVGSPGGDV